MNIHARGLSSLLLGLGLLIGGPVACEDVSEPGVDVGALMANPSAYAGTELLLVGEVERVWHPGVFTVEDPDELGPALPVMMTHGAGSVPSLADDDLVELKGEVRTLVVAEVERQLGWDMSPELELELKGRPVFVATSVRKTGEVY